MEDFVWLVPMVGFLGLGFWLNHFHRELRRFKGMVYRELRDVDERVFEGLLEERRLKGRVSTLEIEVGKPKERTKEELEEELGYRINIVPEKEGE